jgi:hypothetical protein
MLLQAARLEFHAELLEVHPPCSKWLNAIDQELGLKICSPQDIDACRHFCDHGAISMFFVAFQAVFDGRGRRLVFNAGEAQLSSRKRFRVLTDQGHLPLVKAETKLPQITGVCSISAGGTVFRPIIILKQLKSLRSLSQFTPLASFASSDSGWITKDLL